MRSILHSRRFLSLALVGLLGVGCHSAGKVTPATTQAVTQRELMLQTDLLSILNRLESTGAVCGARVIDARTGRELFALNSERAMIPASNMKLPITAAILDRFGPDYAWPTRLAYDSKTQSLWLVGTGDPSLGDELLEERNKQKRFAFLDTFASALKEKGVTNITNLYFVDDAFDAQLVHPSWGKDNLTFWYAAPVSGLNVNSNCIDVTLKPAAISEPPTVVVEPAVMSGIEIVNRAVSGTPEPVSSTPTSSTQASSTQVSSTQVSSTQASSNQATERQPEPDIERDPAAARYTVTGVVTKPVLLSSKPVTDPGVFTAEVVRTGLSTRGIVFSGVTSRRTSMEFKKAKVPVVVEVSSRMSDIVARVNQQSQNLFAEACAKLLGRKSFSSNDTGSWQGGAEGVEKFLSKYKIDGTGFVMADGSGLSRENRVTGRLITGILLAMHKSKHAKVFEESLAVGGESGTIRNRFKDVPGRVRAKTGFIGGVRSLSGYVTTDAGEILIFSFIYNQVPGSVKPYEELQDQAVRRLMKW